MSETISTPSVSEASDNRIGVATLGSYLIGQRDAIFKLAGNRSTLWVGFLFVLSAAFAREYDGEDLLAEPWHLLIPHAASVGSSLLLFLIVASAAWLFRFGAGHVGQLYLQFLSLYWMTAPLAWVYAIPVERFLSAPDSVRANLWFLGLVAAWRVVLIIRVICVLYGAQPFSAGVLVLSFGDALVFVLMQTVDVPLLQVMGGVRLSESEQIISNVAGMLIFLSVITAPIWLVLTVFVLWRGRNDWEIMAAPPRWNGGVTLGLKALVVASLAIWIVVLPITQPEQRLRTDVDRFVEQGKLDEAIALLASAGPDAFPPHWTPPPHVTRRGIDIDQIVTFIDRLDQQESPAWLRDIYWNKLDNSMRNVFSLDEYWYVADADERRAFVELLERQPRERVLELFDGERPYPPGLGNESKTPVDQELDERFDAMFEENEAGADDVAPASDADAGEMQDAGDETRSSSDS